MSSNDPTGIDTLHDAFGELERRADAYPATELQPPAPRRRRGQLLLVAASIAVVLALAILATVRFGAGTARHASGPAGVAPNPSVTHVRNDVHGHRGGSLGGPARTAPPLSGALRRSAARMAARSAAAAHMDEQFRLALRDAVGDSGTFTVTEHPGASVLVGELTVNGVTGGFDIQHFVAGRGTAASCDDLDRVRCDVSSRPGGASLATGSEALQTAPGGITRQANYVRGDGVEFVMHVSNAADPKGAGHVAATPPLTIPQMVAIVTSGRWNG